MRPWPRATLAVLLLASLLAGCSFVFVHGPEVGTESCTTSDALPLIDAAGALASFVALAIDGTIINDHARGDGEISTPISAGVGLLVGGIMYTVAAVGGHHDAVACRARIAAMKPR
jgi:hypothetical protein